MSTWKLMKDDEVVAVYTDPAPPVGPTGPVVPTTPTVPVVPPPATDVRPVLKDMVDFRAGDYRHDYTTIFMRLNPLTEAEVAYCRAMGVPGAAPSAPPASPPPSASLPPLTWLDPMRPGHYITVRAPYAVFETYAIPPDKYWEIETGPQPLVAHKTVVAINGRPMDPNYSGGVGMHVTSNNDPLFHGWDWHQPFPVEIRSFDEHGNPCETNLHFRAAPKP
jgi:hypothetical protein